MPAAFAAAPAAAARSSSSPRARCVLVRRLGLRLRLSARPPPPQHRASITAELDSQSPSSSASTAARALDSEIFALALPALGALALDPLLSLVDTAFVGRLGVSAIAGVGLSTIVLNISFSIFNFLCISLTPLVASATAASNDPAAASRVISAGLLLAFFLGLLSATGLSLFAVPLCVWLGATADAITPAVAYLRARAIASPFALMSLVANGALRGYRDLRTPFFVAAAANILNIALDIFLIFYVGLGVAGAAYATSVSQVFAVVAMLAALLSRGRLRVRDLFRVPRVEELRPMLGAGVMLTIRTLSLLATIAYATATAAAKGVSALAAFELCRQLWIFKATVLDSFAAAAQALVASAMATGATRRARKIANRCLQLAAAAGTVIGIAAIAAGTRLPALFTSSEPVRQTATQCIRVAAVCAPLNGFVFALDGILTACSDYRYMAGAIALASFTACVALTGVRYFGGGVVAVWGGLNLLMVARAAVLFARYMSASGPIPVLGAAGPGEQVNETDG